MRTLLFGATLATALLLPVGQAEAQCCGGHAMASGAAIASMANMPCCQQEAALPADDPAVAMAGLGLDGAPAVQYLDVLFRDPVRVAGATLMGKYLIEHDNDRMARGEPCTYIYEAADLRAPVVTFHCEHLEGDPFAAATVVVGPTTNPSIKALKLFQFGGETAAHGVPTVR